MHSSLSLSRLACFVEGLWGWGHVWEYYSLWDCEPGAQMWPAGGSIHPCKVGQVSEKRLDQMICSAVNIWPCQFKCGCIPILLGYLIGGDVLRLLHGHMDECLTVPSGEHGEEQRRSVSELSALSLAFSYIEINFFQIKAKSAQAISIMERGH